MNTPAPELRDSVGPYRLVRAIGAGGSARIDLARIERAYNFQRHVVIKRPLEHLRGDKNVAASLRREARIGGRLRHPNLVAVLDAGEHDGYDYLILEYVHGGSLRTLMQTDVGNVVRDVPLNVALGIVIDVARGLHDAHELTDERGSPLGLVHRDVSPGNVLLGLDGAIKVADFGIAKETRVTTLSGSMHGSVTYMAPEQCRGHAFDRRADLFSVGVILYELATKTRLFWADNDVASLHRVLSGEIVPPRKIAPQLSPALEEIVMTALAHDPMKRFATAKHLADALEGLAASEGHVVGARWLARTMEEIVGAKDAPWIASQTIPDPPRRGEGSLIAVIESSPPIEEARLPTFGEQDRRDVEEGEVPSAAAIQRVEPAPATRPARRRWRGLYVAIAGGCVLGLGLAIGAKLWLDKGDHGGTVVNAPSPSPSPAPPPPPPPSPPPSPSPSLQPEVGSPKPEVGPVRHHAHHKTPPPPAAGSATVATQPPPTPPPPPNTNVEWKRTLLLPTDTGSASKPK
jgi:serine/threonine protein kinase